MPSPLSRVALVLLLLVVVLPARDLAAQVVVTPTFSVAATGFAENDPSAWVVLENDAAVGEDGHALFFWTEVSLLGGTHPPRALASRLWSPVGQSPYPLRTVTDHFVRAPQVSALPFGGFVTAWQTDGDGPKNGARVLGQFLDDAGHPTGEPIDVADDAAPFGFTQSVVGLPSAAAFAWFAETTNEMHGRIMLADGRPASPVFVIGTSNNFPALGMAALPQNRLVVGWTSRDDVNPRGTSAGRLFTAGGTPLGAQFAFSDTSFFVSVAASPAGDVVAALNGRGDGIYTAARELWLRRVTTGGVPLEDEIQIATGDANSSFDGDVAFDLNGNLYVVWVDEAHVGPVFARGYGTDGLPIGPPVPIEPTGVYDLRALRLPDGGFLNTLTRYGEHSLRANVTSLCTPGTSVCGDGVRDPLCEPCDDGAANSDIVADACRTSCRPAHCGDGVVDAGETCDDGNRTSCDGCSRDCAVETGLGCGDGVPYPACGELCDDGNAVDGDGCTTACELERIPGGGSAPSDCHTEWSVDNAANAPRFDKHGDVSNVQTCTDGDPRCDFDGGVPGSCTFAIAVCVNNTNLPACTPEFRLLNWELRKPSASRALHDPASAVIRAAFQSVVPGAVVGPDARDLCSPRAFVAVPLKGGPTQRKKNQMTLVARASLYSGATDTDKLRLVCLP